MARLVCRTVPLLLVGALCAAPARAENVKEAIDASNKAFAAAVAKGDAAALANLYTLTAKAMPPNGATVEGRAAIQQMWGSVLATGIRDVTLVAVEVTGAGDSAQEVGTFLVKAPDGSVADEGKYVVLWKKEGGAWKLHRDIWNSSRPAH